MVDKKMGTAGRIRRAAMLHFAVYGYSGASLAAIAEEVQIKKPSIYAHYKNKEELFFACMEEAAENTFAQSEALIRNMEGIPVYEVLYAFLSQFDELGEENPDIFFQQRFAYFPPEELKDRVIEYSNRIIERIGDTVRPLFERWGKDNCIDAEIVTEIQVTFICLYDGLMIERLIGNRDKFQYRLKHSWAFFERGLRDMEAGMTAEYGR